MLFLGLAVFLIASMLAFLFHRMLSKDDEQDDIPTVIVEEQSVYEDIPDDRVYKLGKMMPTTTTTSTE